MILVYDFSIITVCQRIFLLLIIKKHIIMLLCVWFMYIAIVVGFDWNCSSFSRACCEGVANACVGHFVIEFERDKTTYVGTIPVHKKDLHIKLESSSDLNLQLYDIENTIEFPIDGKAIVANCVEPCNKGAATDAGFTLYYVIEYFYSGLNGIDGKPGHENIYINGISNRKLRVQVYGVDSGKANVTYVFTYIRPRISIPVQKSCNKLAASLYPNDHDARKANIATRAELHRYDNDTVFEPLKMPKLPLAPDEIPSLVWMGYFSDAITRQTRGARPDAYMCPIIDGCPAGRPQSIRDYVDILHGEESVTGSALDSDSAFVKDRLTGPNPGEIEVCSKTTYDKVINLPGDVKNVLKNVFDENRLYCIDYSEMKDLENGQDLNGIKKYTVGSIAMFESFIDPKAKIREGLKLLAIAVIGILFSPVSPPIDWKLAKALFMNDDTIQQAFVAHFGYAHLVLQAWQIPTFRQLPEMHPLFLLLEPHFEGISFVNVVGFELLFSVGGILDNAVSATMLSLYKLTTDKVIEFMKNDFSFPARLTEKKMYDFDGYYPYKDDGKLIWKAIENFVGSYLALYYDLIIPIGFDPELDSWLSDLYINAKVGWAANFDRSRSMLIRMVSAVIFQASAYHASVNFNLDSHLAFSLGSPMGIWSESPHGLPNATDKDYLDAFPSVDAATEIRDVAIELAKLYYTNLGEYCVGRFVDKDVAYIAQNFSDELLEAGRVIEARNDVREANWIGVSRNAPANQWRYLQLLPMDIPQSINT
jgi:arachidonate 15-lipoxygenase